LSLQTTIADAWRAIVHALAPGESTLANPAPWIGEAFQMSPSAAGKVVTPQTSMRVAAVYACVAVLSQSVGQLPLIFYKYGRDGSTEPALDHPLYPLLRHLPNPEVSSQDMREMAMLHLCLRGNAYHQIVRSGGQVTEINSLHPDYVRMYRGANGRLAYDYTPPNGGKVTLGDDEVWRITGMSFNGLNGLSPISYARESIGLSMATEEHGAKLFSNGAQIATAFEHPGVMSPEAQKRFQESIHSKYAGSHNAFKTIILEEGMKVAKLAMTSVDSQFIEARKYQLEEICRIYRVPPHKIQDLARATFNNIEHLSMDFVNSSLMPWLKKFEESINRDLLLPNERKKYFARFDVDSLQRGDMQARANYYASGIANTWFSPNEARAKEFLNPREGGDKFENPNTTAGATKPNEPIPDPQKG
jgi:HK97 family phage portal protein